MTFAIIGALITGALIVIADRLAQQRTAIARQMLLRVLCIMLLIVGVFVWARYWILYAVSCSPHCTGDNLVGWDLENAVLRNSDFIEANLRGATLRAADLYNADFSGANLDGVNLQNANLRSTRLIGTLMTKADFRGAEFGDTDLRGAALDEADLTRVDLTRAHLDGVSFDQAKLVQAKLSGKNLAGLSLVEADLTGADLTNADLSGSRLSGANLSGAQLAGSNLAGAWLNLADLTGADLRNTNLAGANLLGANLASANLSNSQLIGTSLIGAHVNGTNLLGADLTGSRLLASELMPVDLLTDPLLQELNQLQQLAVITDVDLSGVRFNRQTKWPMGRTSLLAEMLGPQFLDDSLSLTSTQGTSDESKFMVVSNNAAMPLTEAIYQDSIQDGDTPSVLLDNLVSSTAFSTFCSGDSLHLIASNQPFPADMLTLCTTNGRAVVTFTVAIQALVVVVNPTNNFIDDISLADLRALTAATRWSDINLTWPRTMIQRYVPDVETVTFRFWVEKLFQGDAATAVSVLGNFAPTSNGALLVQGVNNDPYAVGVLDYAIYFQNISGLKLLRVEGNSPTQQTISDGSYPLAQPLYLFGDANQLRQLPALRSFVLYYMDHANRLLQRIGLFAVSPELAAENQQQLNALGSTQE